MVKELMIGNSHIIVHMPDEPNREEMKEFYDVCNEIAFNRIAQGKKPLDWFYSDEEWEAIKADKTNVFI